MAPQIIFNGLIAASSIALIALSFAVIYRPTGFFHFAHGAIIACGAYAAYALHALAGVGLWHAVAGAIATSAMLGVGLEIGVYRPLRRRGATGLVLLLASLGLYVVLQNVISLVFGDDTKSLRSGKITEGVIVLGGYITWPQIGIFVASILCLLAMWTVLKFTRAGKSFRAVANDRELALVSGIDVDKTILTTFAVGSGLAGLAGVLLALDVDMSPTMGMNALMMGVVVVIVGGIESIPGIALAAILLGMAQQFASWTIGSQWQETLAFLVLVCFLILRPQGFFGKPMKETTIWL